MEKHMEGTKIDKYYINEQIGEGAFAEIYIGVNE
jgi:hypothetical protein